MPEVETREEVVEQPLSQGYREDAQDVTVQYHKPGTARPPSEKDVEAQEQIQELVSEDSEIVADPGDRVYQQQDVRSPELAYATRDNIVVPVGSEAPAYAEAAADVLGTEVDVAVNPGDRYGPVVAVPADGAYRPDVEDDEADAGEILYTAEPSDPDEDEAESEDEQPKQEAADENK